MCKFYLTFKIGDVCLSKLLQLFSFTRMKTLAIWSGWFSLIVLMFTTISVFPISVSAYQAHQVDVKVNNK